jgi:GntR family transcriptional regulator, transcriptional repressor for pyruvate dehydrogenase complex
VTDRASPTEAVYRDLRSAILRGQYLPGSRLPSERELAARHGVNRASAREVLKRLEQLRLIEIHKGGARVVPREMASLETLEYMLGLDERLDAALVAQCLEVVSILLAGAVRLAVERASVEELARARDLVRLASAPATSDEEYLSLIQQLAQLLSSASRNVVLGMARNALRSIFDQRFPKGRMRLRPPRAVMTRVARTLDEAMTRRDVRAAEEAVRDLLSAASERLLKAIEAESAPAEAPRLGT